MALSDVNILYRLSNSIEKVLPGAFAISMSWEVNNTGRFVCSISARDFAASGLAITDMRKKWLTYVHPVVGTWGGIITQTSANNEVVTIAADSWAVMLRQVVLDGAYTATDTLAVALGKLINNNTAKTGLTMAAGSPSINADAALGAGVFAAGLNAYDDILPRVVDLLAQKAAPSLQPSGYTVDAAARQISFKTALGTVWTNISINDAADVTTSTWNHADPVNKVFYGANYRHTENEVVRSGKYCAKKGVPIKKCPKNQIRYRDTTTNKRTYNDPTTKVALSQGSIDQIGEQAVRVDSGLTFMSIAAIQQAAADKLAWYRLTSSQVSVEIGGISQKAADSIWSRIREGDVVPVNLSNSGKPGRMVVRVRALDVDRDVLVLSGEADLGG